MKDVSLVARFIGRQCSTVLQCPGNPVCRVARILHINFESLYSLFSLSLITATPSTSISLSHTCTHFYFAGKFLMCVATTVSLAREIFSGNGQYFYNRKTKLFKWGYVEKLLFQKIEIRALTLINADDNRPLSSLHNRPYMVTNATAKHSMCFDILF